MKPHLRPDRTPGALQSTQNQSNVKAVPSIPRSLRLKVNMLVDGNWIKAGSILEARELPQTLAQEALR
jgi:hypothetical protein